MKPHKPALASQLTTQPLTTKPLAIEPLTTKPLAIEPLEVAGPEVALSEALHARVRRFIDTSLEERPSEPFEALARALARFQCDHVEPVGRLFAQVGVDPDRVELEAIPALPTEAFRLRRIAAHARDARCFVTSGTSAEARGEHPMRTTATYRHAALAWGRRMLFPREVALRVIALVPSEHEAPESSLTFMIARFAEALGGDVSHHLADLGDLERRIDTAKGPILVAGTSFALLHLADTHASLPLPPGSRVMQTGGFKGKTREVSPGELRSRLAELFAVPRARIVGEYGMTELSSQLYQPGMAGSEDEAYLPPPWLRVNAVDPETLAPLPTGEIGLGRFVDLANVDSAIAIVTADRIRLRDDGAVELHGRQPGAIPRGCSLAVEAILT